ncbi:hypothetical protein F2P79_007194 [Pimephales promelas]|nr:hypothetical protein F2P79_007194 [Pimephales promelas]
MIKHEKRCSFRTCKPLYTPEVSTNTLHVSNHFRNDISWDNLQQPFVAMARNLLKDFVRGHFHT